MWAIMNSRRDDFPILQRTINGNSLIYFDNAATSLKPTQVIDAISNHYRTNAGNPGRSTHTLAYESKLLIDSTRKRILQFINASPDIYTVIFTKSATESLNLAAKILEDSSEFITTVTEHHSNFLPWMDLSRNKQKKFTALPTTESGEIELDHLRNIESIANTVLAFTHGSNVTGFITDLEKVLSITLPKKIITVLDASQTIAHIQIDLSKTPVDFLAASAHKMFGSEGVGFLVAKKALLKDKQPLLLGGGSIESVSIENYSLKEDEERFEAGTYNTSGIVGLAAAIDYIEKLGFLNIQATENSLIRYLTNKLEEIPEVTILGYAPIETPRTPIISFTTTSVHAHDIADFLDTKGIAVRAGFHCAEPLHKALHSPASVRVSLSIFNTTTEIDIFITAVKQCLQKFA